MTEQKRATFPILLILFIAAVILLLNFIIPPFQSPDEPHNFGAIMIYAWGEDAQPSIEKDIIRMMDRHNWWKLVGMGRPAILPEKISDIPFLMDYSPSSDFRSRLNNLLLYHFLTGKTIGLLGKGSIALFYYICRLTSILFFLGALFFIFLTLKSLSGIADDILSQGFFFIIFLPQFMLTSVAVSADAFSIFLSSAFFYAAFSLMKEKVRPAFFPLLFLTAGAGFLADRSVFLLIVLAAAAPFFWIKKKNYKGYIVLSLAFLIIFILLLYGLVLLFPLQFETSFNLARNVLSASWKSAPRLFSLSEYNRQFFTLLADSFLLRFGWMAFSAARIFYVLWKIFILVSAAGLTAYLAKLLYNGITGRYKKEKENIALKWKVLLFSLGAVVLQVFGLWVYYGANNIFTQGRYLFPVIVPLTIFFLIGLKSFFGFFHKKAGPLAVAGFLVLLFLFFNYVLWAHIVPVFHLTVQSPHPGV